MAFSPEQLTEVTHGSVSVLEDIRSQVDSIKTNALENGETIAAPVLALGVSERVGSNWFLATLANTMQTHNEPFRQQLHRSHQLSTICPQPLDVSNYPLEATHPFERYWLSNFVLSKYSKSPQVIKETNLFFSTTNFTNMFPDSTTIILARNPIGIAGSFADNDLFRLWNYAERYNQLKAMTRQPKHEDYAFIFDGEHDPGSLRKLTRLIVLNSLLISEAVRDRDAHIIRYEDSVLDRTRTLAQASEFLSKLQIQLIDTEPDEALHSDHVFSTRKNKSELSVNLDKDEVSTVRSEVRRLLSESLGILSERQYLEAQRILEPMSDEYSARGSTTAQKPGLAPPIIATRPVPEFINDPSTPEKTFWANQLTTNEEFVHFLNAMHSEGIPNVINGTQLFFNENMITERGGRIWFNSNAGAYEVVKGYETYPLYWVTWLGAAAYARFSGCRLPTRAEIDSLTEQMGEIDFSEVNCDHVHDDVTPNGYTKSNAFGMYDSIGNLAIWCIDGFNEINELGEVKFMYGTAWNKNGDMSEVTIIKARPITGSSRGVGVRLVKDAAPKQTLSAKDLAARFDGWFTLLSRTSDNAKAYRYIADQLTV